MQSKEHLSETLHLQPRAPRFYPTFGKVTIGQAVRPLMAFVMVLSYSRQIFLRFFLGSHMANFLRGHVAADRKCPGDRTRTVREVFAEEKPRLLALPENPFPTEERTGVRVGKTPYVRFDLNDYSIPHTHVRRTLEVVTTLMKVRILDDQEVIATHDRSWDRGQQIENPAHIQALVDHKRQAREHRGLDRLYHGAPSSQPFFVELANRGGNLGATTSGLLRLLDRYGARALDEALAAAVTKNVLSLGAVRQILDQQAHAAGKPPPITVALPDDPRVRDLIVKPHALTTYDHLQEEADDEEPGDDQGS